jgi:hypothetical protein
VVALIAVAALVLIIGEDPGIARGHIGGSLRTLWTVPAQQARERAAAVARGLD